MSPLAHQRCSAHIDREAAVRCPECLQFYCRECVTEHAGRMVCTRCIARIGGESLAARSSILKWSALSFSGFLFAWLFFYYLGMILARIPDSFVGGP